MSMPGNKSTRRQTKLWCICQQPQSNRFMICCHECQEWFHGSCVGVSQKQSKKYQGGWFCHKCTKENSGLSHQNKMGIDELKQKTEENSVSIQEIKTAVKALQDELSMLRPSSEKDALNQALQNELSELQRFKGEADQELEKKSDAVRDLEKLCEEKDSTILRLKTSIQTLSDELAALQRRIDEAVLELQKETNNLSALQKLCKEKDKTILRLKASSVRAFQNDIPALSREENASLTALERKGAEETVKNRLGTSLQTKKPLKHCKLSLSQPSCKSVNIQGQNEDDDFIFKKIRKTTH